MCHARSSRENDFVRSRLHWAQDGRVGSGGLDRALSSRNERPGGRVRFRNTERCRIRRLATLCGPVHAARDRGSNAHADQDALGHGGDQGRAAEHARARFRPHAATRLRLPLRRWPRPRPKRRRDTEAPTRPLEGAARQRLVGDCPEQPSSGVARHPASGAAPSWFLLARRLGTQPPKLLLEGFAGESEARACRAERDVQDMGDLLETLLFELIQDEDYAQRFTQARKDLIHLIARALLFEQRQGAGGSRVLVQSVRSAGQLARLTRLAPNVTADVASPWTAETQAPCLAPLGLFSRRAR